jgi:hypothetical protein
MRQEALKWWRGLTEDEQIRIVSICYPDVAFNVIATSSLQIERMFKTIKNL